MILIRSIAPGGWNETPRPPAKSRRASSTLGAGAVLGLFVALVLGGACDSQSNLPNMLPAQPSAPQTAEPPAEPDLEAFGFEAASLPDGPDFVPGRLLVKFREGTPEAAQQAALAAAGAHVRGEIPQIGVKILELPAQASETARLRAFKNRPEVEFVELDHLAAPAAVPNDTWYWGQWHLPRIGCEQAWDTTTGATSITIAILDTGVDPTHPDLASKLVPGWSMYEGTSDTTDNWGHGTLVAGVASAAGNNALGVASPAWNCRIMPIRVIHPTSGLTSDSVIASALVWAADHGARVANASFSVAYLSSLTAATRYMTERGGITTFGSGNSGSVSSLPNDSYSLTVGAIDSNNQLASFSTTGMLVDLCAPGVGIYSTARGGGYGSGTGTSCSAPLVAGVAALILSTNPTLTGAQVQAILQQSADDLGSPGWDPQYGSGRVNAARAVAAAAGTTVPNLPDTTPPTVGFTSPANGATVSGSILVRVSASDSVGVTSVQLAVDGAALATDTVPPYDFAWDTTTYSAGAHALRATAWDAAGNTASASINVTVNNAVADTTPPAVSITSPANGATVNNMVNVLVSTSDNVGVTMIELWVDGRMVSASTSPPFTTKWNSKKAARGAHTLQCRAYDAAGNVGFSQIVTVYR
jgi:thermitase